MVENLTNSLMFRLEIALMLKIAVSAMATAMGKAFQCSEV
jgi:hypothetical protein